MKKLFFSICLLQAVAAPAQKTLQERLGYPKDSKLLILHADDLGMSHSENAASFYAMEHGSVNSASIMVPTPWFSEVAAYARTHPTADLGVHLTLTSEWNYLKWGPVASKSDVTGLVNKNGFLYSSVDSVHRSATAAEVEKELRAQIEKARQFGIDITHLDSHMGTIFGRPDFLKVLIRLGREYKLPVLLSRPVFRAVFNVDVDTVTTEKDVVLDMIYMASAQDYKNGMDKYYTQVLKSLHPGVSILIFHVAYDDSELKAATIDHAEYGSAWRQADFNFFTSENCRNLLKQNNIHLITWREIRDKLLR
ncbi:MAG TPA: polysaccharide deacetylase family protein [Chitinophagaceae bacterium]|nr:polysaccharide deacetylase family protein [Chitinophagaceae bacterium]